MKRVQERSKGMPTGASVNDGSLEARRTPPSHGRSTAIADKGSLFIFCTEREVEFLILQIEQPASRKAYLSEWKASVKIANRKKKVKREIGILRSVFFIGTLFFY